MMKTMAHRLFRLIIIVFSLTFAAPLHAADDPRPMLDASGKASFLQAETLIRQIAATGDVWAVPALEAFAQGDLYVRKSDSLVFLTTGAGASVTLIDPLTGEKAGEDARAALTKIKINNTLRRVVRSALGGRSGYRPTGHRPQISKTDRLYRLTVEDKAHIEEILTTIRLTARKNELAADLSHGQKQWLEIGMLLAQEPELLLVDEPVAGMTDTETAETAFLLKEIAKSRSVVVVKHDRGFIRDPW